MTTQTLYTRRAFLAVNRKLLRAGIRTNVKHVVKLGTTVAWIVKY